MSLQLAELAIHIPAAILLFEKYELNYYQNGSQTLRDACTQKGLCFEDIDNELNKLQKNSKTHYLLALEDMDINRLIDFINGQHHDNEAEILSFIHNSLQKLIREATDSVPIERLIKVEGKFTELKEKLFKHCEKEDRILFPQLRKIVSLQNDKLPHLFNTVNEVKSLITLLEAEHRQATDILSNIRKDLDNYNVPENSSFEYSLLMKHLKEFESDLHIHLHIENNVLFPKFRVLEEKIERARIKNL